MNNKISNSFLEQSLKGKKVLILAPHQDDEINLGGQIIRKMHQNGAEIFIVYSTNSDFSFPAETRIAEAYKACEILGVDKEHIILMGYGDTSSEYKKHIYESKEKQIKSASNHISTYGILGKDEYCFHRLGFHHTYCSNNYLNDLKNIIKEILADIIICVDLDQHPDHKMLSISFEKVMDIILKEMDNNYYPLILKRFAYSYAYYSYKDFPALNICSTKRPRIGEIEKYDIDIHGSFNYIWSNRIRIPVDEKTRTIKFKDNILVQALNCYKSQYGLSQSSKIIKGDLVYWERRTDNAVYKADIKTTSGNIENIYGFQYVYFTDILSSISQFKIRPWIPNKEDLKKTVTFKWNVPIMIKMIVFIPTLEIGARYKVHFIFNDNYNIIKTNFENNVQNRVLINYDFLIKKLDIMIESIDGSDFGISGFEIFETYFFLQSVINPFIKIIVNNEFIYSYFLNDTCDYIKLDIYKFHTDSTVIFRVIKGEAYIEDNCYLYIMKKEKPIIIRAELVGYSNVYDQVEINFNIKERQKIIKKELQLFKIHELLSNLISKSFRLFLYFKRSGLRFVLKKLIGT